MLSSLKCTFWCIIVQNSMKTWDFWTGSWWKIFGVTNWAWIEFFISGCLVACSVVGYPVFYFILFKYKYLKYIYIFWTWNFVMDSCVNYDVILATFCQPLVAKPHQITCHSNVLKCYNYVAILIVLFVAFFIFLFLVWPQELSSIQQKL